MHVNENGIIVRDELTIDVCDHLKVHIVRGDQLNFNELSELFCGLDHNVSAFIDLVRKMKTVDSYDEAYALVEAIIEAHD